MPGRNTDGATFGGLTVRLLDSNLTTHGVLCVVLDHPAASEAVHAKIRHLLFMHAVLLSSRVSTTSRSDGSPLLQLAAAKCDTMAAAETLHWPSSCTPQMQVPSQWRCSSVSTAASRLLLLGVHDSRGSSLRSLSSRREAQVHSGRKGTFSAETGGT